MQRIKLIWDFRSVDSEKIASHHVKHLQEYILSKKVENSTANFEKVTDNHWIAFIETEKVKMIELRDALKPHRGQLV